MANLKAIISQ